MSVIENRLVRTHLMNDQDIHYAETRYGFEYGAASIERMYSHRGMVGIRIVCHKTGEYVDVQVSPGGRRMHVTKGNDKRLSVNGSDALSGSK